MGETIEFKRGRPLGYKLSEATKHKIRLKRIGTHHTQATRDKISASLIKYFNKRTSLADNLQQEYGSISREVAQWVYINRDNLNNSAEHIFSNKKLNSLSQLEVCFGNEMEYLFGHNATPEFFILIKEELEELGDKELLNELRNLLM